MSGSEVAIDIDDPARRKPEGILPDNKIFVCEPGEIMYIFLREANGLSSGALLLVIPGFAGGGDDVSFGDSDPYVIVAEIAVELTLVEIGHRVPAPAVINGRFGIPLSDLVSVPIVSTTRKIEG